MKAIKGDFSKYQNTFDSKFVISIFYCSSLMHENNKN